MNDPLDSGGEAAIGWAHPVSWGEFNVFGPVEGLHWAVQAFGCMAENELPDPDRAADRRAVSEF